MAKKINCPRRICLSLAALIAGGSIAWTDLTDYQYPRQGNQQPVSASAEPASDEDRLLQKIQSVIGSNKESWINDDYLPFLKIECTSAKNGENLSQKTAGADYLEELLKRKGFQPRVFIGKDTPDKERLETAVETGLELIRPVVYFEVVSDPSLPTILFDTHYDRRPFNSHDPWLSSPLDPVRRPVTEKFGNKTIQDERIYARGADDSVGHIMGIIWAIEAYQSLGKLPVNVKVMFEGAEEIGSPGMGKFVERYKEMLKADLVVIDDNYTNHSGIPLITERLRGFINGTIEVETGKSEGHSGSGSYLPNALGILSSVMNKIVDPLTKKVHLDSYTNAIKEPTPAEIDFVNKLFPEWTEENRMKAFGAKKLVGDSRYSPAVRTILQPSWDWEAIPPYATGKEGVIPASAGVVFNVRTVADQDGYKIMAELEEKLKQLPESRYATIRAHLISTSPAFVAKMDSPYTEKVRASLMKVFGSTEVERDWSGAGEPIASFFQSILKVPVYHTGFGHPDDNAHAVNESMLVDYGLLLGVRGNAGIIYDIGQAGKK